MAFPLCNGRFGARKISSAVAQAVSLVRDPIDRSLLGNKNGPESEQFYDPFLIYSF